MQTMEEKPRAKDELVGKLLDLGISQYRIHKELNVTPTTVKAWVRGWWMPTIENRRKLRTLIFKIAQEKGIRIFKD